MVLVSYHASHEQFAPSRLLRLAKSAEAAGFAAAKSSDHFHPWSERQGQSGFAWSWLASALEATRFPIGIVSAPGYRYHPAVLAQAAATVGEMYPGRTWLALGSGEAINEAITGLAWPDKAERNARLRECVDVIRALFVGDVVTHRGRVTVVEAKLYTRPAEPVPLFGAAMSAETASVVAGWADGLLTAGHDPNAVRPAIEAFRADNSGPVHVQMAVSFAGTRREAEEQAVQQWSAAAVGGEVNWDLRRPADFDLVSRFVRPDEMGECVFVTDSLSELEARIGALAELGADVVHLHPVAEDQEGFIAAVGENGLAARHRS